MDTTISIRLHCTTRQTMGKPLHCRNRRNPSEPESRSDKDEKEQQEKEDRLRALFDGGDTTFSTPGVIDVNVLLKKKGGTGKKREGGQTEGGGDEAKGEEKRTRMEKGSVGKENSTPSHPPALRERAAPPRHQQPASVVAMDVEMTAADNLQLSKTTAVRAIVFR